MTHELPSDFDRFGLPLLQLTPDALSVLSANAAAAQHSGYSQEELAGLPLQQLFPQLDLRDFQRRLGDGEPDAAPQALDLPGRLLQHKEGSRHPVDLSLRRSGATGWSLLLLDAAARQTARDQLHYVLRATQLGYWDWDLENRRFEVDQRWLDIFGRSRASIGPDASSALSVIHPEDVAAVRERIRQQILYEDEFTLDFRATGSNHSELWVRCSAAVVGRELRSGHPLRVCGTVQDITLQKEAQQALRMQQELHASLLNNTEDVICHFDREHRHTYVNPAIADIWNYAPEDYIGKTRREMGFPEALCKRWEELLEEVFRSGKPHRDISNYDGPHGTARVYWYAFPGLIQDGKVQTVFTMSRDITDYARAEDELRKMQKLSSLGVLAGGIAHDFNNILTSLFGNIALARSYLPEEHRAQRSLNQAEQAFHRATHLTSQLLTFAKGGDPVKQDVSIASFIEEVVRFDLSGSNVKLEFSAAPELWKARVDKAQIAQVFSNLTSNANQAMPHGGHLYVSLENCTLQDGSLPGLAAGDYLRCTVRDEGVGIAPGDLDKIFDPYFSTRREGSGLGLATVYSIITKHGGHISVSSRMGEGSTFTLHLPASGNGQSRTETKAAEQARPASNRILIMDDEAMICELGTTFLGNKGYRVDAVQDGKQAIARYAEAMQAGDPYACLLMDLTIPGGMSGKDALVEILKLDPEACAIVSSGYAADPVMANFEAHGFKGCITKPFFLAGLLKEIRRVLGEDQP
jgi:PAS domain S-box-containing protein